MQSARAGPHEVSLFGYTEPTRRAPDHQNLGIEVAGERGRSLADKSPADKSKCGAAPVHAGALTVVVVENEEDLCHHADAWQDLADNAIEANVFYEPWLLRPALQTLNPGPPLRLVFVYETDSPASPGHSRLCGFFPLEPDRRFQNSPIRAWRLWKHLHCFLCTPLIRPERARETLAAPTKPGRCNASPTDSRGLCGKRGRTLRAIYRARCPRAHAKSIAGSENASASWASSSSGRCRMAARWTVGLRNSSAWNPVGGSRAMDRHWH